MPGASKNPAGQVKNRICLPDRASEKRERNRLSENQQSKYAKFDDVLLDFVKVAKFDDVLRGLYRLVHLLRSPNQ